MPDSWGDIRAKLAKWLRDPASVADEGLIPPSAASIQAVLARLERWSPFWVWGLRVIPNGDGGVIYEWGRGSHWETLEFAEDGSAEERFGKAEQRKDGD